MEDVFAHRWLVHRTLLLSVLGYLLCCVSQFAMASGLLEDPKPKFVTSESYFTSKSLLLAILSLLNDIWLCHISDSIAFFNPHWLCF
jgi:hypothetical protein